MSHLALPLLRGRKISLEDALGSDANVLDQLKWPDEMLEFCYYLYTNLSELGNIVSRHLGIPASDLRFGDFKEWRHGSFNTCIPIHISNHPKLPRQVIIRFPQPFKVGEAFDPGNVDEKLRAEAATYIWLRRNCPAIPIPRLFAIGLPGTQSFTALENESLFNRLLWCLRRLWVGRALSPYCAHRRDTLPEIGYLIIEYVEEGEMLSQTWENHFQDQSRRANLLRGLSQALVTLAKIPHPKIGSWTIDDRGALSLTNRPLVLLLHEFESHNIPTNMPRDLTYSSVEPWVLDMLARQDNRMRHQPNAIHHDVDGRWQLGALTGLRALLPNLVDRQARGGPFVLSLTDLHASNIFVDGNWHITRIIDLEFSCVLPLQMVTAPAWLTDRAIDKLTDDHLEEYKTMYDEFVDAEEQEEQIQQQSDGQLGHFSYSEVLRKAWSTGGMWYSHALTSTNAFSALFDAHILPRFGGNLHTEAETALMKLWSEDAVGFIAEKATQQEAYNAEIRDLFATAGRKQVLNAADAGGDTTDSQDRET